MTRDDRQAELRLDRTTLVAARREPGERPGKVCARWVLLSGLALGQCAALAAEEVVAGKAPPAPAGVSAAGEPDPGTPAGPAADAGRESILDRHKRGIDSQVQRAALWVDSFFSEPNYEAELATSQFRVRPELHYRREQDLKARAKVALKLSLPNVSKKISLIAGSDPDDTDFAGSVGDRGDNSIIGLQFFGRNYRHLHSSVSIGLELDGLALFVGPRLRYEKPIGERSSARFTQTFRWQTGNNWHVNSRLDFNHALGKSHFFRQSVDGLWQGEDSDEEGYRVRVGSFLTRRLGTAAGLQYEFSTIFHTRPDSHVDKYTLLVRYRKRSSRDWLYYEVVPELSFEDAYGFRANPGIRLRVEFFYGEAPGGRAPKGKIDDAEEFRW